MQSLAIDELNYQFLIGMLFHIRYQEKNQLRDHILPEVEFSSLMARGLAVPDINQQRREMVGLTLNSISDQFFARFFFFEKLRYLLTSSNYECQFCSEQNMFGKLLQRALVVLSPLLRSLCFLFWYLFVFFFELFFTISLPEDLSHLFYVCATPAMLL